MAQGTWWGIPDIGLTENVSALFGGKGSTKASTWYNPAAIASPTGGGANIPANPLYNVQAGTRGLQPVNTQAINNQNIPNNGGGGGGSVLSSMSTMSGTETGGTPDVGGDISGMQNEIGGAWDNYTAQLDAMLNTGIPGQQVGMQQTAEGSANLATTQAEANKLSTTNQVNQQQASTLKDLGENVKNLFQAGNTYLGARGAGDSTAANQYAYALSKMGTKERGNILTQVNQRLQQIGDIFNTEKQRIKSELDVQMGNIAQWFSTAQNTLRTQLAQAGVSKASDINALSQQLLDIAIAEKNRVQAQSDTLSSNLQTWAMNNSKTTAELAKNFQTIGAQAPTFTGLQNTLPTSGGSATTYARPVGTATKDTDMWGNPIG